MNDLDRQPDMAHFLASSVHDMKNSISILIAGLEAMLPRIDQAASSHHAEVAHMIYESKRINSNLIHLLTLYKSENDLYPFDPQPQSIGEFLRLIGAQSAPVLKSRGIALEIHALDDASWDFDEDLIVGVIGNALNNAIRYTRDRVLLSAKGGDGFLEMRVEDNGDGYPQKMLEDGVKAMHGVDFLRGSTGLGLHFSALAARMHRNGGSAGSILLENGGTLGGGCFVLRLP